MKTKIFIIIALCLLSFSCRTKKAAIKTDTKITETAKVDTRSAVSCKRQAVIETNIADNGTVNETTDEIITETNFSTPDSEGKQYKTTVKNIKRTIRRGENKNLKAETKTAETKLKGTTYEQKINAIFGKDLKVKEKKQEEIKSPTWTSWGIIALLAGLFFLCYIVIKKYLL